MSLSTILIKKLDQKKTGSNWYHGSLIHLLLIYKNFVSDRSVTQHKSTDKQINVKIPTMIRSIPIFKILKINKSKSYTFHFRKVILYLLKPWNYKNTEKYKKTHKLPTMVRLDNIFNCFNIAFYVLY